MMRTFSLIYAILNLVVRLSKIELIDRYTNEKHTEEDKQKYLKKKSTNDIKLRRDDPMGHQPLVKVNFLAHIS